MPRTTRPNILFITCDQWRGDSLSAAGHPVVRTPNADALAAEGVIFLNHFAGAAPCSPARACLYTGLYQMNNRVCRNGTPLDARHDTLALAARRLGYDPTLFGYTDTTPDPRLRGADDPALRTYESVLPGFSVRVLLPEHQKPWLSWLAARGSGNGMPFPDAHRPVGGVGKAVTNAPAAYARDETPGAFLAGEFIRWLSEQDAGTPWFAHLSFLSPHPPFVLPEPWNTLHAPDDRPFPRRPSRDAEADVHPFLRYVLKRTKKDDFLPGMKGRVRDFSDADFRQIRATYHGMIAETDSQLGRLWQALKARGMWDDTVVVLTSDHAELMGDHYLLGKGGFLDGGYHIPLIVRDPRRAQSMGRRVERFTEAVDVMPTLTALMGGRPAPHLDGASLAPFLDGGEPPSWREEAHWEFDFRNVPKQEAEKRFGIASEQCNLAVLRGQRYKYVHFGGGLPPLLFDLRDDPGELRDLADDPAHMPVRLNCAERLLAWRARHLDRTLSLSQVTDNGLAGHVAGVAHRP
jgi:arylsulfatase A-like enzyme